jgi:hypothetical protein
MKFYYIARKKKRGYSESYVGDGVIEANSRQEAKRLVADIYKSPVTRVKLSIRH